MTEKTELERISCCETTNLTVEKMKPDLIKHSVGLSKGTWATWQE
jgi:hypothetical protein